MKAMVKTLVRVTALAGALAIPPALAAQGDARPITLDEAVRLARRNAPASVQARNQIRSTAAAVRTRYGAFLPTLSFGGGAQTQQGQRYSVDLDSIIRQDAPWRANHSLSSNLDLFSGGRRYFDLMTARANVDAAEATEVSQSFAIARDVKQQYFAVLAAREQQAAAKVQLEQAQQQLRAAVARVAAGAATMSDSLRSIIQVGNARLATLNADNALATANATLSRLVGSDAIVTAVGVRHGDRGEHLHDRRPALRPRRAGPGGEAGAGAGRRRQAGQALGTLAVPADALDGSVAVVHRHRGRLRVPR
jgi:outer membrane protein TolC